MNISRTRSWILIGLVLGLLIGIIGCNSKPEEMNALDKEARASFQFFWEQANLDPNSAGYGLIRDRYPGNSSIASIAATGFGLSAIPIGVERGWISAEEGFKRATKTLDTLLYLEHQRGFFYHFVNIKTGKREWESEISSILELTKELRS